MRPMQKKRVVPSNVHTSWSGCRMKARKYLDTLFFPLVRTARGWKMWRILVDNIEGVTSVGHVPVHSVGQFYNTMSCSASPSLLHSGRYGNCLKRALNFIYLHAVRFANTELPFMDSKRIAYILCSSVNHPNG